MTAVSAVCVQWPCPQQTLSDGIGEDVGIKLGNSSMPSVDHLFPDLCDVLQTRRQFLVLWDCRWTSSLSDPMITALLRLVGRPRCNTITLLPLSHCHNENCR